jgi:hypothetical protein
MTACYGKRVPAVTAVNAELLPARGASAPEQALIESPYSSVVQHVNHRGCRGQVSALRTDCVVAAPGAHPFMTAFVYGATYRRTAPWGYQAHASSWPPSAAGEAHGSRLLRSLALHSTTAGQTTPLSDYSLYIFAGGLGRRRRDAATSSGLSLSSNFCTASPTPPTSHVSRPLRQRCGVHQHFFGPQQSLTCCSVPAAAMGHRRSSSSRKRSLADVRCVSGSTLPSCPARQATLLAPLRRRAGPEPLL